MFLSNFQKVVMMKLRTALLLLMRERCSVNITKKRVLKHVVCVVGLHYTVDFTQKKRQKAVIFILWYFVIM